MTSSHAALPPGSRPEWEAAWKASALHARVVGAFQGIPDLLAASLPTDGGVLAAPGHWHTAVYGDLVLRKIGAEFAAPDCYKVLRSHGIAWDNARVADALVGFLAHLKAAGHVTYDTNGQGRPTGNIRIVADLFSLRPAPVSSPAPQEAPAEPDYDLDLDYDDEPPAAPAPVSVPAVPVPSKPKREPRSAAETTWLRETTQALTATGLAEGTVDALLEIARWGTPVTIEAVSGS